MTGDEFIRLAGKLATSTDEASLRTAVSRAYYGTFHLALAFFDEIGHSIPRNANAHIQVARKLQMSGHADAYRAGSLLGDLHSDRIKVDYRLDDSRTANAAFAKLCVERAHEIRNTLDACRTEPARSEISARL